MKKTKTKGWSSPFGYSGVVKFEVTSEYDGSHTCSDGTVYNYVDITFRFYDYKTGKLLSKESHNDVEFLDGPDETYAIRYGGYTGEWTSLNLTHAYDGYNEGYFYQEPIHLFKPPTFEISTPTATTGGY